MLNVKLLGKFEVQRDDQLIALPLRAAQSLLAYLMLNAGTPHRREQLAGLFWPDMPESNAKSNLRQTLSRLRKAIGDGYLVTDDLTLAFDSRASYWLDAEVIARKVEGDCSADELISAVLAYHGELLPGFYDEWALLERERLHAAFEHKMSMLTDRLVEAQRWEEVLHWGERWIALGHTPEAAYRALISAHGARGDISNAAAVYQRCEEALRRDLSVEPSPQTRAELERVKREAATTFDLLPKRPRTNLPAALTSFIGREKEIAGVRQLIANQRTVTLTGSGGAGKTRLAIESASSLVDHFADGVWLIEFAPLNDAALILHAVASTLGLLNMSGRPIVTALIDVLREKHRLLIFDNCEHLIEACAQLATALLSACPHLHILSTSREPLGIPGEIPFRVPPLSTPDRQHLPVIQELAHYEAVQLFVERGAAVVPAYALTGDNAAAIARICQRLDGMPLAIELAAARLKTLRAEEIATRLDDRFRLLTGGSRVALPRQQTLRATIEWSYNLLSAPEQSLLQRLSVFAGGWTLEAAEEVCSESPPSPPTPLPFRERGERAPSPFEGEGRGEGQDVLDLLTHLADKSLVNVERAQGQVTRYHILETIRQYARERLLEAGGGEAVRDRHLAYFVKLVEQAEPQLYRADQVRWFNRLEAELDNLRIALAWALATNVESGLRIVTLPWPWWNAHGNVREMGDWLAQLLERYPTVNPLRAQALAVYSFCLYGQSNFAEAIRIARQSSQLARSLSDKQTEALGLMFLGTLTVAYQGRYGEGISFLEQSLDLYRALGDKIGQANVLSALAYDMRNRERAAAFTRESLQINRELGNLSGIADSLSTLARFTYWNGDFSSPTAWLEEALSIVRQIGDQPTDKNVLFTCGSLAYWQGNYRQAHAYYEEVIQSCERLGNQFLGFWARVFMAYTLLRQGEIQSARQLFEACIQRAHKADWAIMLVFAVEGLASLNVNQVHPKRAARLIAWADTMRDKIGDHRPPVEQASVERDLAILHAQLDDDMFKAEQEAGRKMTMDEVVACALSEEVVN